jgi:hypothetical protein
MIRMRFEPGHLRVFPRFALELIVQAQCPLASFRLRASRSARLRPGSRLP